MIKELNRIKVALAEKKRTNWWLAEQLGKDEATVSKWCTNKCQPSLEAIIQISNLLGVQMNDPVKKWKQYIVEWYKEIAFNRTKLETSRNYQSTSSRICFWKPQWRN